MQFCSHMCMRVRAQAHTRARRQWTLVEVLSSASSGDVVEFPKLPAVWRMKRNRNKLFFQLFSSIVHLSFYFRVLNDKSGI